MELVIKAAVIGIVAGVFAVGLKKTVPDVSLSVQLTGAVLISLAVVQVMAPVLSFLQEASSTLGTSGVYVQPVLKCLAIGVVSSLGCALCRDAGQGASASALELLGTAAALYAALPLLRLFLTTIGEFL